MLNPTEAEKNKWVKLLCVAYINGAFIRQTRGSQGKAQKVEVGEKRCHANRPRNKQKSFKETRKITKAKIMLKGL